MTPNEVNQWLAVILNGAMLLFLIGFILAFLFTLWRLATSK